MDVVGCHTTEIERPLLTFPVLQCNLDAVNSEAHGCAGTTWGALAFVLTSGICKTRLLQLVCSGGAETKLRRRRRRWSGDAASPFRLCVAREGGDE